MPAAQWPDAQSGPSVHEAPLATGTAQTPLEQKPDAHSVPTMHAAPFATAAPHRSPAQIPDVHSSALAQAAPSALLAAHFPWAQSPEVHRAAFPQSLPLTSQIPTAEHVVDPHNVSSPHAAPSLGGLGPQVPLPQKLDEHS